MTISAMPARSCAVLLFLTSGLYISCTGTPAIPATAGHLSEPAEKVSTNNTPETASVQPLDAPIAGNVNEQISAIAADNCFRTPAAVWDMPFIASSVISLGKQGILLNTPEDDAHIVSFDSETMTFSSRKIAEKSQIACARSESDGFLAGIIERDAQLGTFSAVVKSFSRNSEPIEERDWRVTTRGFMPDPGTRCALSGNRELYVIGTRPRGERIPYHGLFRAQPRALDFFEQTAEHTPVLSEYVQTASGKGEILLRETRRDAADKPVWPYVIYEIGEDNTLSEKQSADFIFRHDSEWIRVTKNGCVERDNSQICAENAPELTEVMPLETPSGELCMQWFSWNRSWIACTINNRIQTVPLPNGLRMLSMKSTRGELFWGYHVTDKSHPDIAGNLSLIAPDMKCLGAEN